MEQLVYSLYLSALIIAPLAFGTIDLWALVLVEGCCFLTLGCHLFTLLQKGQPFIKVPGLVPLLLFLLWTAIQCIPLPPSLVALVSPATAALYTPLLTTDPTGGMFIPLSVHPFYTLQDLFRFSAYAAVYFLTVQLLHDPKRMRQTLTVMIVLATGISLYAIIQHYTDNDRIFWFRTFTHRSVVGSFAYKNHFAAYIELLLPLTVALFFHYRPTRRTAGSLMQSFLDLCNRVTSNRAILHGAAAVIMMLALLLSESRGGVFCAVFSLLLLLVIARKRIRFSGLAPLALGLLVLIVTGVGRDGLEIVDQRFGNFLNKDGVSMNGRVPFWKDSLPMIADFPLTGTGAGTFRTMYARYQQNPSAALPLHAHNDYLETLTNGGLIAVAAILAFLGLIFRRTFTAFRRRRDPYVIHLYLGSLAGLIALLVHCLIELQFRVSAAVGLGFFFLLGVHVASVTLKQHRGSTKTPAVAPLSGITGWGSFGLLALFIVACFLVQIGELRALAQLPELTKVEAKMGKAGYENKADLLALEDWAIYGPLNAEEKNNICERASVAQHASPLNPRYRYLGSLCAESAAKVDNALAQSRAALLLNPVQSVYAQRYATLLDQQGNPGNADLFFQAAIANDPTEVRFHRAYIARLIGTDRTEDALRHLAVFLAKQPEKTALLLADLDAAQLETTAVEPYLPPRIDSRLAYAAWLEKKGDSARALQAYDLALSFLDTEERIRSAAFSQLLRFYRQQKDDDKTLVVLQRAVLHLPKEHGFRLQLGDLYSRQGMHRKAMEEYQMALQIQPGNAKAAEKLKLAAEILGHPQQ